MNDVTKAPEAISVESLKGVGPKMSQRLARLGIGSIADLLLHLPVRYQDRTLTTPIGSLQTGMETVIEGEILLSETTRRTRPALLCRIADGTGSLTLRFFHFSVAQKNKLAAGTRLRCYGEVRPGPSTLEMVHPEYRYLDGETAPPKDHYLTPIYPTTEGLHQATLRSLISAAMDYADGFIDYLPPELRARLALPMLADAVCFIHHPPPPVFRQLQDRQHPCQQRLLFEELLAHQLSLRRLHQQMRTNQAPVLEDGGKLVGQFLKTLPFSLTAAQQRVLDEIAGDLKQAYPMQRLLQGDVGSGKTVVAAAAALQAIALQHQVAIMAPTELLAEQHYLNFRDWLQPLNIEVTFLTGSIKGKTRKLILEKLHSGKIPVVIGTHALFQKEVLFQSLALIIVDEQHRFGVHQRLQLREKGRGGMQLPHQLIMTATPIPRTLAMSVYADLDTSIIDELPPGRTPVKTVAIANKHREAIIERIRTACQAGRQAYWVCTLIDDSDILQAQAAASTAEQLTAVLPTLRIGLIHGRLKPVEKETIMTAFKGNELDLLVATTVIEVGVDVPNASLMIIENAERLGLAQLHQLRGRVGRGAVQSSCVLLYQAPLSPQARQRLGILRASNDGFIVAQRDLELRGPGEVLGTRQTGEWQFRIADLMRDQHLLPRVQRTADQLLNHYPANAEAIVRRWIGDKRNYGIV